MSFKTSVLLGMAFRPFFLMNGLFAILVICVWVMTLHGIGPLLLTPLWHSHEMLMGFVMAAVAGFSLTAVATWTGRPALQGAPLAWLLMSWLVGRVVMLLSSWLPVNVVLVVDTIFPALLCVLLAREIIAARNKRNYPLVAIIGVITLLNVLYHLGSHQWLAGAERLAIYLLIHTILLLVVIIAGRIVPTFTANWLRNQGIDQLPVNSTWVNRTAISLTVVVGLGAGFAPMHPLTGVLAFAAVLIHGFRLGRWKGIATTSNPLLFVLHVAYAWIPSGYFLLACSSFGWFFSPTAALHALTMGAVGSMILAVTTRVALGHTGRPLQAARATVVAYWVFTVAVLIRVLGPLADDNYLSIIDLSAVGWIIAFAIFSWVYWPILTGPRPDR